MAEDTRPAVFIGSSSEGLNLAYAIEQRLVRVSKTKVWADGAFGLGQANLEALMKAVEEYDFAVLVLTPDDVVESRGQSLGSPRDNVIFEFGLFMGRLGRFRTFAVCEHSTRLTLPSDLAGVTVARLIDRPDDVNAAVSPACTAILQKIHQLGRLEPSDRDRGLHKLKTQAEHLQETNARLETDLRLAEQRISQKEEEIISLKD